MTRLITEWIVDIEDTIRECEGYLKEKTGLSFDALAAKVSGCSANDIVRASNEIKVAVVPITSGQGVIGFFSQSVAAVINVLGFQNFITDNTDVNGIYEAYQRGADIVYIADDDCFISMNLHKNKVIDNNYATAAGYVTALEGTQGTLAGKEILLLGYGILGQEFMKCLKKKGVAVTVYDIDKDKLEKLKKEEISVIENPEEIANYRLIIDATSEGGWLHQHMLHPDVWIVSPGIPLSLDEKAYQACSGRIIHDYLQIGVAAMLGLTL